MLDATGQQRVTERLDKDEELAREYDEAIEESTDVSQKAEQAILAILSGTLLQTGGIVNEQMGEENAIRCMVNAGSKGPS